MGDSEKGADDEQLDRLIAFATTLRRTHAFHSEPTEFHYPGLVEREFHSRRLPVDGGARSRDGGNHRRASIVMAAERAELVPYIQYPEHEPLDQWRALNRSPDWTAIHLLQNGDRVDANARHCPQTWRFSILDQPQIRGAWSNAMFSLLAPNTAIPPACRSEQRAAGVSFAADCAGGCWFRVGGETRYWRGGEALLRRHRRARSHEPERSASSGLHFRCLAPRLEPVEREAIAAAIEAETPGAEAGL